MIVVLDNLRSAQNVGSIIRTCDALGISEVYLCGITPDIKNPKVLKTSLGAEANILIHDGIQTLDAVKKLSGEGKDIVALELTDDAVPVSEVKGGDNTVLVVGNEVSGISEDILKLSDQVVMIPMQGIKESLNVSVAFGIAAYELASARKDL
jgi:23S rRNA (guanosine2251-2'-O)-methyltransferase